MQFFLSHCLYGDYVDGFSYIEPSLHPWDGDYIIVVDYIFDMFFDSGCGCLIEYFFASMFIKEICLKFSFFGQSLYGIGIRVTGAL